MVGVVGAGSFGTAVANLLAANTDVLIFSRRADFVESVNSGSEYQGVTLHRRIRATLDPQAVSERCTLLFFVVPSGNFREILRGFSPYLRPHHIVIHGTKGFDLGGISNEILESQGLSLSRSDVRTMSEVVLEESSVVRVGCLSGPNLAAEIVAGQPTATVIASRFKEVIHAGQKVLNSRRFHVFGSYDLLGAELAGALKNIIALGSGILGGLGMGRNVQGLLIAKGLGEMVHFGLAMGASNQAFVGVAGIGDLVATATSTNSRNYTFGTYLAQGLKVEEIRSQMPELAEGVRTLRIAHALAKHYKLHVPITDMLYAVVFEGVPVERALEYLMTYPYGVDVDYI